MKLRYTILTGIIGVLLMFYMQALFFSDQPSGNKSDSKITSDSVQDNITVNPGFDTSQWTVPEDISLINFKYQPVDFTQTEYDSHWHTDTHEPIVVERIETDSSTRFTLVGAIPGGQPIGGDIRINSDTLMLVYYIIPSQPPYAAIRKVKLEYEIRPRENVRNIPVIVRERN